MSKIIQRIKEKKWGNSLTRTGFLQPKAIAAEAIMLPVELIKGVIAKMDGYIWVNDFVTYSQDSLDSFPALFKKAFEINYKWPLSIINSLDELAKKENLLVEKMKLKVKNISQASNFFKTYVNLLHEIMRYYVIAVPLTDYCENELIKLKFNYSDFAVAYKELDIDLYNKSIKQIARRSEKTKESVIKEHLTDFAWIKTAYNIINPYTKSDLLEALKSSQVESARKFLPTDCRPELIGLQCGIFMRNRMKELCQKLWYAFDPIAIYLANQLSLSREEFLTLTPDEAFESIDASRIPRGQIKERQKNFVVGFINDDFILLAGDSVGVLSNFFNPDISKNISEFKGNIACKGIAKGVVRIIKSKNEFNKFNKGEILVTSMTTPDFILIMKKSLAIITDEGGLSSHAAIVSRELKTPCIIGTKIATKVLHNGDLVEVDANKGIVKILKSSEKQTH